MTEQSNFDKRAASWDVEPRRVELAREVANAIITSVHPTAEMDALDFGCGTGLLTLFLQPHLRSITGIDSSRGMLDVLAGKVREQGLANVRTLLSDVRRGERPDGRYHLIVSGMTLHHVAELAPLFRLFHELLLPGGIVSVADLDKEDGTFHDDPTGVHHFGLERPLVKGMLTEADITEPRDTTVAVIQKGSPDQVRDYPVFLISARKPF
jgi:2-polyprenyl-3-methyl-5-hydroxy-6-metoxy-1,4-benzoquinol methylase